jgi:hypothetical protein
MADVDTPDTVDQRTGEHQPADFRPTSNRGSRPGVWIGAAAIVTLLVGLTTTLLLSGQQHGNGRAAGDLPGTLVGSLWGITAVRSGGATVEIPRQINSTVALYSDGQFIASDGINGSSGRYVLTAHGFRTQHVQSTLIAVAHPDNARVAAVNAITAVTAQEADVRATIGTDGTLTLTVAGYRIVCTLADRHLPPSPPTR